MKYRAFAVGNSSKRVGALVDKSGLFRHVNDSIRQLATEDLATENWGFICECPDATCHVVVTLTLVEFDERRAASPPVPVLAVQHGVAT